MRTMFSVFIALCCLVFGSPAQAEIRIGRLGSQTHPMAKGVTQETALGFDVYVKKINAAGGIRGEAIKVVFGETEFKPDVTLRAATELVERDDVVALVNAPGTPGVQAILKDGLLTRRNVALIGPVTGAPDVLGGENVFPIRADYMAEVKAIVKQMSILQQKRVVGLIYNIPQGVAFEPALKQLVTAQGLDYAGAVFFDLIPDATQQAAAMDKAVQQAGALKPDAIMIIAVGPTFPLAVKTIHQKLPESVMRYTFSVNAWDTLMSQTDIATAQGVAFSQAVPHPSNRARRVASEYLRDLTQYAPGAKPGFAGLEGYITAKVLVHALERSPGKPTRKSVLSALLAMDQLDVGNYMLRYSPKKRVVDSTVDITIIDRDGKLRY